MLIRFFCTPGAATDLLRRAVNASEFGERLIGRLNTEAIPGIGEMRPAERPLTHVQLLDTTSDGALSFYAELSGVTPKKGRNLHAAAMILQRTLMEEIGSHLPRGQKMDLFVVVTPIGEGERIELLLTDLGPPEERPDHTD